MEITHQEVRIPPVPIVTDITAGIPFVELGVVHPSVVPVTVVRGILLRSIQVPIEPILVPAQVGTETPEQIIGLILTDDVATLSGPNSILNRSLVVNSKYSIKCSINELLFFF